MLPALWLLLSVAPTGLRLEVDAQRDLHPISPLIYGANDARDIARNRFAVLRLGGNRFSAYNWENNASNAGSDYHHQNDGYLSPSDEPGAVVAKLLEEARANGAAALITLPIGDYVAADRKKGGDVRATPKFLIERFKRNRATKVGRLSPLPDARDGFVNQDEFVAWLKRTAAPGAKVLVSLDNEPDLWSSTHPAVHPAPVGYDELCVRNITFAKMVKQQWPDAEVTGFVSYGWNGVVSLQDAPDQKHKGEFVDYWLKKMAAAERAEGRRLVDYLDLHWYPEARGGGERITSKKADPAVVAARVQAPRSLWDPTYREHSWIADALGASIRLLPRMKEKIAAHYPGTRLAITEWNFGGGGHISGAVATADALGIFGREGVGLASFWELNGEEPFAYAAFRAFRNYDGQGAAFGDTSVFASSSDPAKASIYASVDSNDPNRLVLIAINKSATAQPTTLQLSHPSKFRALDVYALTERGPQALPEPQKKANGPNRFEWELPAMSVSVLVPVL